MLTFFTVLVLVSAFIAYNVLVVVPMRQNFVVERLGSFRAVCQPGLHILIPFIDRVAYRHEVREQVLDIPAQSCISRDNIQVAVDGLVYLKVMDAKKASYGIGDYKKASVNLAQTTMRSEVGKLTLGDTFSERDTLNEAIVREIDKASDPWGIKVLRYEIRNITPSSKVVHTLEKQMEAERSKRAEITLATAQKDSKILTSQGHRQEAINLSEGNKIRRINEAKGRAREIEIVAEASAEGIRLVGAAIQSSGGRLAVKMRLIESYLDQLRHVLEDSKVSVLPFDLATVRSLVLAAGLGDKSNSASKREV